MSEKKHMVVKAFHGFRGRVLSEHRPDAALMVCCDSAERGGENFDFSDAQVFRMSEIASVIPPYHMAPPNVRSKFSFAKMKNMALVAISGHSECGGAQIVTSCPCAEDAPSNEIGDIVQSVAMSGADLPRLVEAFTVACEGNVHHAANLLSRHLTIVSLDNISGYPSVSERILEHKLDIMPLYHVMKRGTGKESHLEIFNVLQGVWKDIRSDFLSHMCLRPNNCDSCESCQETIRESLEWVPLEVADQKSGTFFVEVPSHIAGVIRLERDIYQPRLHSLKKSEEYSRPHERIGHLQVNRIFDSPFIERT